MTRTQELIFIDQEIKHIEREIRLNKDALIYAISKAKDDKAYLKIIKTYKKINRELNKSLREIKKRGE